MFLAVVCALSAMLVGAAELPAELKDASHEETDPILAEGDAKCGKLTGIALMPDGNLLACDAGANVIKVVAPGDKLVASWKVPFAPTAVLLSGENVYVGGESGLAKFDRKGTQLKIAAVGKEGIPEGRIAGLAATDKEVYASYASTKGALHGVIVRVDADLAQPKIIVSGLRGCCGNMDITCKDNVVWAAENAGHRVRGFDREGKPTVTWGSSDRTKVESFGGCCNPMNLYDGGKNVMYTGESSPDRIKKYDSTGKYLGLVGYVGLKKIQGAKSNGGCSPSRFAVSQDGSKIYVVDSSNSLVRVLTAKAK